MRKFTSVLAVVGLCFAVSANAGLIISEVCDGTVSGGLPKFVELTNTGATPIDLSGYSLGNINNGAPESTNATTVLSGILAPGDSYVCSYENSDGPGVGFFLDTYGFEPDNYDFGSWINGDDVIVLYAGDPGTPHNGTGAIDVYGVVGVNGDGEFWDYTDGYSYRLPAYVDGMNPIVEGEWFYGGLDSLEPDGVHTAAEMHVLYTTPGTHDFVPEPGTLALLLIGAFGLIRRR